MNTIKKMTLEDIKKVPPMTDEEKKELLNSPIEYDEDCPKLSKTELAEFKPYKSVSQEKRPVTLRLSENDISALKKIAENSGLPYQTLVSSILHRYVNDELVDKTEVQKIFAMSSAN